MGPKRLFVVDAAFEAALAAVLLGGVASGWLDAADYPAPITSGVLVGAAVVLMALGLGLALLTGHPARVALMTLASVNAATAAAGLVWLALARGFSTQGATVLLAAVVVLALLAALQAHASRAVATGGLRAAGDGRAG